MENNNNNTTVKPNENPGEEFIDDLDNITSQVESALIGSHLSCDIIDLILSTYLTPEVPINIGIRELDDPSGGVRIRYNNLARLAEEEHFDDATETIEIEESAGAVVEELPIAADAADVADIPTRRFPEFDGCMNWRCNDCEKFTVALGVGVFVLFFIIFLAFVKQIADGRKY